MKKTAIKVLGLISIMAVISMVSALGGNVDDFCLTDGGTENQGQCTTHENMPAEEGPGTVDVKWCEPIVAGAPGSSPDCSGNAMNPQTSTQ